MIRRVFKLPILLVIAFALAMATVYAFGIGSQFLLPYQITTAAAIFCTGTLIILAGGMSFKAADTTFDPRSPEKASRLVTTGVYRFSRNPMYLGFSLFVLAFAVFFGQVLNLALVPVFVAVVNYAYILPEEQALEKLFTAEFEAYKKRVRRWI